MYYGAYEAVTPGNIHISHALANAGTGCATNKSLPYFNHEVKNGVITQKIYSLNKSGPIENDNVASNIISGAVALKIAKNSGSAYGIESYTKRWYILGLLMLVCKGRDIQNSIGYGYTGNSEDGEYKIMSEYDMAQGDKTANSKFEKDTKYDNSINYKRGLFFGTNTYTTRTYASYYTAAYATISKCFGIMNFWGGLGCYISGIFDNKLKYCAPYKCTQLAYLTLGYVHDYNSRDIQIMSCDWDASNFSENETISIPLSNKQIITDYSVSKNGSCLVPLTSQSDLTKGWTDYIIANYNNNNIQYYTTTIFNYYFGSEASLTPYGPFSISFINRLGWYNKDYGCFRFAGTGCRLVAA